MKIAGKPGVYKDFSGKIKWKETACVVRNADFEILRREVNLKEIVFADAVFVSGIVCWGTIKNGLNLGCNFYYCDIDYMINKGGKTSWCTWRDGVFEGGIFRYGTWFDGVWIKGVWDKGENSSGIEMKLPPDKWEENKL